MIEITRLFQTQDGRLVEEKDLTPGERSAFTQSITDIIMPKVYEIIARDLKKGDDQPG